MKLAFLLVVVAACGRRQEAAPNATGPELFAKYCTMCHGPTGKPDATMVARLNVRDLTAPEMRARITPALVETQMRNGSQNKLMPSFQGLMTDPQIRTLAEYVASPAFLTK